MMDWLKQVASWSRSSSRSTVGAIAGAILGVLYLIFGFWHMIVFLLFVAAGYTIGRISSRRHDWREVLDRLLPPRYRD